MKCVFEIVCLMLIEQTLPVLFALRCTQIVTHWTVE